MLPADTAATLARVGMVVLDGLAPPDLAQQVWEELGCGTAAAAVGFEDAGQPGIRGDLVAYLPFEELRKDCEEQTGAGDSGDNSDDGGSAEGRNCGKGGAASPSAPHELCKTPAIGQAATCVSGLSVHHKPWIVHNCILDLSHPLHVYAL
jgi:hypothetical protein